MSNIKQLINMTIFFGIFTDPGEKTLQQSNNKQPYINLSYKDCGSMSYLALVNRPEKTLARICYYALWKRLEFFQYACGCESCLKTHTKTHFTHYISFSIDWIILVWLHISPDFSSILCSLNELPVLIFKLYCNWYQWNRILSLLVKPLTIIRKCVCVSVIFFFSVSHFSYLKHSRRPLSSPRVSDYTKCAINMIQCDSHALFYHS